MGVSKWNLVTGVRDDVGGTVVRPPDVHATILTSMGLDASHLSNQNPRIITRILR